VGDGALGAALALFAALTTAGAHGLIKWGRDKLATRFLLGLTQSALALPLVLIAPSPSPTMWLWLGASAGIHLIYQLMLVRAYELADFSVAYPVARGVAPAATAVLGIAILADHPSVAVLGGVGLVTGGLLTLSLGRRISRTGLAAAAIAGLLTTVYTLVDAYGVRLEADPTTFIAWFLLIDGLMLTPIFLAARRGRITALLMHDWWKGLLAGAITVAGFGGALWAMTLTSVGAVSALRETGVIFALLFAAVFLKERIDRRRLAGAGLMLAGIVLIVSGA